MLDVDLYGIWYFCPFVWRENAIVEKGISMFFWGVGGVMEGVLLLLLLADWLLRFRVMQGHRLGIHAAPGTATPKTFGRAP